MLLSIVGRDSIGAIVEAIDANKTAYAGLIPQELIDDEVGDDASVEQVTSWIMANSVEISTALKANSTGGFARAPFNRIVARELK